MMKYNNFQAACQNVFDFDIYNAEASKLVVDILQRHGIPVNAKNDDIRLAAEWTLQGNAKPQGQWLVNQNTQHQIRRSAGRKFKSV